MPCTQISSCNFSGVSRPVVRLCSRSSRCWTRWSWASCEGLSILLGSHIFWGRHLRPEARRPPAAGRCRSSGGACQLNWLDIGQVAYGVHLGWIDEHRPVITVAVPPLGSRARSRGCQSRCRRNGPASYRRYHSEFLSGGGLDGVRTGSSGAKATGWIGPRFTTTPRAPVETPGPRFTGTARRRKGWSAD